VTFLNLHGNRRPDAPAATKVWRVLRYYARLVRYAATAAPPVFHILWNAKLDLLDRTLLMLYYRLLGKKIVLTAHNVNAARRDATDTVINRLTLRIQYRLAHHIFVHTTKMKRELADDFGVPASSVTVIRHPVNSSVPTTPVTPAEAKVRLGIEPGQKTILFFGSIRPYKGLEYLTAAFQQLVARDPSYRLLLAAEPKKEADAYLRDILNSTVVERQRGQILQRLEFIPDEDTELYFKAADVLALPYTEIFQSGVLFLAYTFGLPVVVTDVGSFREDIVEGETGFICRPRDAADLADTLEAYFRSDLFANLERRRPDIQAFVSQRHSWTAVSEATRGVYARLTAQ
jgi:glycosyltransferase involved in cell wall biosynthesis